MAAPDTLKRVPVGVPQKRGVLAHYLSFFANFTDELHFFKKGMCANPCTPLESTTDVKLDTVNNVLIKNTLKRTSELRLSLDK